MIRRSRASRHSTRKSTSTTTCAILRGPWMRSATKSPASPRTNRRLIAGCATRKHKDSTSRAEPSHWAVLLSLPAESSCRSSHTTIEGRRHRFPNVYGLHSMHGQHGESSSARFIPAFARVGLVRPVHMGNRVTQRWVMMRQMPTAAILTPIHPQLGAAFAPALIGRAQRLRFIVVHDLVRFSAPFWSEVMHNTAECTSFR